MMKNSFVFVIVLVSIAADIAVGTSYPSPWVQKGIHKQQGPGYLGQINNHNCGPHALMQSIFKVTGVDMKEATLANWAGTTTSGTGHDGIEKALKRFNSEHHYNLTINWFNFHDVSVKQIGQWMANPRTAIFFHLLYRDQWGHYELPYNITSGASTLVIANSLGDRKGDGYLGYFETRSWAAQKQYIAEMSQKSVCVITYPAK